MLTKAGETEKTENEALPISEAAFPMPFYEGLEYSSPARGVWNIAHTGMLIPESHEIFVCALGCLRGVVLTAAEMNALDRYSAIQVREENVLQGGMEELMIDGVTDIIGKLPYRPRAILIYISCQHFFLAYEQKPVFEELRRRFPDIYFLDCYMIPTLRKSGMTPTQRMQIQVYRLWEKPSRNSENGDPAGAGAAAGSASGADRVPQKVNLIGSNLETARSSELVRIVEDAGYEFWDLYRCKDFDDYMGMADACLNLVYDPTGLKAAEDVKKRLGTDYIYMTFTYDLDELEHNYEVLAGALETQMPDLSADRERAERAILHAREVIGDTPVAVDYTFTFRILSFARMLLEHGFNVTEIYADSFVPEDKENFEWIRERYPDMVISATVRPAMRYVHGMHGNGSGQQRISEGDEADGDGTDSAAVSGISEKILAVGQKAAYFAGTDHFVNVAESGGYYGYDGIVRVMELMEEAFLNTKDRKELIQMKGYGCESCL